MFWFQNKLFFLNQLGLETLKRNNPDSSLPLNEDAQFQDKEAIYPHHC